MKADFLSMLPGMTVLGATHLCQTKGYRVEVVEADYGMVVMGAVPNTVVLWEKPRGMVKAATPGDPTELDSYEPPKKWPDVR